MDDKQEIVICLGSSCFSRGNRLCMGIIEKFLKDNHLEEKFFFHGSRCFDKCEKGPILKIGDKIYEGIKPEDILDLLKPNLEHKIKIWPL
jgi:NADH:ubiquinone oxidoreductase subunit E